MDTFCFIGGYIMSRKGRSFELNYEWLYKLDDEKYNVTSPAMLYDKTTNSQREVDVLVEYIDDKGLNRKIGIECRDRRNVENSMWIEQLTIKKEDLELDYIVATTTRTFTKNAIKKAAAPGVIIERAETFDEISVKQLSNNLYLDIFFLKFEFITICFKRKGRIYTFRQLLKELNFAEQCELISELKGPFYYSLDPHKVLDSCGFKMEDFYKDEKNNIVFKGDIGLDDNVPIILKKLNISYFHYEVLATPLKVTYPVNKQISVFTVEPKQNKKFKVRYGSDEEYFECGYVDDGKIQNILKLKKRKYYRYIGMNMCINTIFPKKYEMNISKSSLTTDMIGEISFEKII